MSVLKIRDENGNIIEIPAFKGEKGDDAVIDINYNPQSENAQSGKAVAEAVSNIDLSGYYTKKEIDDKISEIKELLEGADL